MKRDVSLAEIVLDSGAIALGVTMLSVGSTLTGFVLLFAGLIVAFAIVADIVDTRR